MTVIVSMHAQGNRWSISAENTLSFVNASSSSLSYGRNDKGYRAAYNAFLRTEYKLTKKLSATFGMGYLQTREFVVIFPISDLPDELQSIQSNKSHHYVLAPVGLNFSFGSFFIRPEIGIGVNTANTSLDEYHYNIEGNNYYGYYGFDRKNKDFQNIDQVHNMTYPLFLTMGTEIPVSSFRLLLGFQGFYTLNTIGEKYFNQRHAYGFGSTVGVKF